MKPRILSEYLTVEQLAQELGVCSRTVDRWRSLGEGPPTTAVGRKRLFRREAVANWLSAKEAIDFLEKRRRDQVTRATEARTVSLAQAAIVSKYVDAGAPRRLPEPDPVANSIITARQVKMAVKHLGVVRIDDHPCGKCRHMRYYSVEDGTLYYYAGCDCDGLVLGLRISWQDAAIHINRQMRIGPWGDVGARVAANFGITLPPVLPPKWAALGKQGRGCRENDTASVN